MSISRKDDINLKIGNLIIAIWLSTVPTAMTVGLLWAHGLNVCRVFGTIYDSPTKVEAKLFNWLFLNLNCKYKFVKMPIKITRVQ